MKSIEEKSAIIDSTMNGHENPDTSTDGTTDGNDRDDAGQQLAGTSDEAAVTIQSDSDRKQTNADDDVKNKCGTESTIAESKKETDESSNAAATTTQNEEKVKPSSPKAPPISSPTTKQSKEEIKPSSSSSKSTNNSTTTPNQKVKIHFCAVGSAPLMKKSKFLLSRKEPFRILQEKMRRMLQLPPSSALFLYINSCFVPSPMDYIGDLNDLFSVRGELQIHYSLQEAWG